MCSMQNYQDLMGFELENSISICFNLTLPILRSFGIKTEQDGREKASGSRSFFTICSPAFLVFSLICSQFPSIGCLRLFGYLLRIVVSKSMVGHLQHAYRQLSENKRTSGLERVYRFNQVY